MTADREQFKTLAAELRDLQDATKGRTAAIMERALGAGFDPAGVRRFVAWKRQDEEKRAQREAIDHQCRYLAGEVDMPAVLPIGCELARALNCLRQKKTVRQAADELQVSTGKAGNLYKLARMFDVHVHNRVDKPKVDAPPHNPGTGEIIEGIGHNSKPACILVTSTTWKEITSAREQFEAARKAERDAERERRRAEREAERAENADTLDIPPFLRRTQVPA